MVASGAQEQITTNSPHSEKIVFKGKYFSICHPRNTCGQHLKEHLLLEEVKIQTGHVQEHTFWNRLECFPAKSLKNAANSVEIGPGHGICILALEKLLS